MLSLVLTGGIATGKSTACRSLLAALPGAVFFDADASVCGLLAGDAGIAARIVAEFGPAAVDSRGRADRSFLREIVFSDPHRRLRLEAILHPRVRQECLASRETAATRGARLFLADIPLFYETEFDCGFAGVLVAACSRATQIRRLKARNAFDDRLIASILAAQLPIEEKLSRADIVFWNEGPPAALGLQIHRFAKEISHD